jgi:outer membrane biosynthesis protein TonB
MRAGFVISVLGHALGVVIALIYADAIPFNSAPPEAIAVDIVTPNDIDDPSRDPAQPERAPSEKTPGDTFGLSAQAAPAPLPAADFPSKSRPAEQPKAQPQRQQPAPPPNQTLRQTNDPARQAAAAPAKPNPAPEPRTQPAPSPPPEPPTPPAADGGPNFANLFAMPLALPGGQLGGGFDAPAYDKAQVASAEGAAFREHVKSCAKLPASISPADKVRIVLRITLKRDGTLAGAPTLIEASASVKGPVLMQTAINALRDCQPYAMLPADKYDEWKVIDLTFTPQDLVRG